MSSRASGALTMRIGIALMAATLEVAAMAMFGLTETHHDILGTTGAIAVLIAVAAAVLAGPLVGCLAAMVGGIAFFGFVTGWGDTAPLTATIVSVVIWSLAALMTGMVADRLRHQRAARSAAEDEARLLHARLESSLFPHLEAQHGGLSLMWRYLPSEDRLGISGDFCDAGQEPSLEAFVTLCLAWFAGDGSHASILLLGHPAPLLISEGRIESVAVRPGLPLGLADPVDCAATGLALPSAWSLLLYTDGLIEGHAGDPSQTRFGLERLVAQLERETRQEARDELGNRTLDRVLDGVMMANGGPVPDDVAVFCVSKAAA
jgi:hypothetical protein